MSEMRGADDANAMEGQLEGGGSPQQLWQQTDDLRQFWEVDRRDKAFLLDNKWEIVRIEVVNRE
jgi:hypothetical protein